MTNKIIKGVATSLLLSVGLTACGTEDTTSNANLIDIIGQMEGNQDEIVSLRVWGAEEDTKVLEYLIEEFKKEHNGEATFDITVEAVHEGDCKNILLSDINSAPDVFTFADDQLISFAAAGVIEPIVSQEEIKNRNLEGAVEAVTINDKLYAYPLTADNGYFMYYNSDYFTAEDVKSLDRMIEVAEQNNKKIAMDWSSGWYLYSFFGNTGLTLGLNSDYVTNYCTWNAADGDIKGTDVLAAMKRIISSKAFVSMTDEEMSAGIEDGSVIAGVNGVWNAIEIEEVWQDGYAATKLPTYTVAGQQVQMASYAGYKVLGVNAYSDDREWAEKLAEYLTNEQSQIQRFKDRGQGPSNINASNLDEVSNSLAISALIEQSEFADIQRIGELYWPAATELGERLVTGDFGAFTDQTLLDYIVESITSSNIES